LFAPQLSRRGVVDIDDEWGRRLAHESGVPVTTVGEAGADWTVLDATMAVGGGTVTVLAPDGAEHVLSVQLPGRFNLSNAALAFVVLIEAGVPAADAARGIGELANVPGRMERIDAGQPFAVLVDYAHTPVAVAQLLAEARAMTAGRGRVAVVLGCGGDRDAGKRPLMGAAAAVGADLAVFTNDNPRSEDPQAILDAMLAGARDAPDAGDVVVEPDRQLAVARAVKFAEPGDVVIVAGKGHEQGQEQGGVVQPFDDRDVVRMVLAAHGFAAAKVRPA
jgi:UDP-N-acetylmuramoyl-L-alanyl-D-glutamate--2,6-diaminopimelate ligase